MSNIFQVGPKTEGHQTNSADIQRALDKIDGKTYTGVHFAAGTYLIDDSIERKNPYSVIAIKSGSEVFGDMDQDGKITTVFRLMDNAPLDPFKCSVPILGSAEKIGTDIKVYNLEFDGNNKLYSKNQNPSTNANCEGTNARQPSNHGKGFHTFIGTTNDSKMQNCSFYNIYVHDSAGDGFRTLHNGYHIKDSCRHEMNNNIKLYNWTVINCGHCALMFESTTDSEIYDCKVKARSNGAVRTQKGCSKIKIRNILIDGTENNYNPGMQITGNNFTISNCKICGVWGPGIEVQGKKDENDDINILDNTFINCGSWPFVGKDNHPEKYSGVGGIITNGANVKIERNLFSSCKGYAIGATIYRPDDDGDRCPNGPFKIYARNNIIISTSRACNPDANSGIAIANLLSKDHSLIADGNFLYPDEEGLRYCNVVFENPVDVTPAVVSPDVQPGVVESPAVEPPVIETPVVSVVEPPEVAPSAVATSEIVVSADGVTTPEESLDIQTSFSDTAIVIPVSSEDMQKLILSSMTSINLQEGKDFIVLGRK